MRNQSSGNNKAHNPYSTLLKIATPAMLSLLVSCGGGGSSSDGTPTVTPPITLGSVTAQLPINGAKWNDYVQGIVTTATDTACVAASDTACIHGGERRVVVATGMSSCAGLTASDDLGAFNWVCDGSTNPVQLVSTGLAPGKNLSDLIDFGARGFLSNKVTVYHNGSAWGVTPASTAWWANSVIVNNNGGNLVTASAIYLVTADTTNHYTLDADKVALVIQPGVTLSGPGTDDAVYSYSTNHLWLEGNINTSNPSSYTGVNLQYVNFSMLRNLSVQNGFTGVYLAGGSYNALAGVTVSNSAHGIDIGAASNNTLAGVTLINNYFGVNLASGSNNNILAGITASNSHYGVELFDSSNNNILAGITASNNYIGVYITSSSNNNILASVTASNNNNGVSITNSDSTKFWSLAMSNDGSQDISLDGTTNTHFDGLYKDSGLTSCQLLNGAAEFDANCSPVNTGSNFARNSPITLANSFVGMMTGDDTQNASDASGAAADYPAAPITFDWTHFDNSYRGWGIDGSPAQGQWTTGPGRIWDWSLLASDTVIKGVQPLPTGNDFITHTWSDSSTVTFLRNAVEIQNSGGNNNGLCESNETCLYTPNIGSYQGQGNLISAGTFTDGTLIGITLMKYETNGV